MRKFLSFKKAHEMKSFKNESSFPKLFLPFERKNCYSDQEKLLKFEAEDWEFADFAKNSERWEIFLEQCFFTFFLEVSQIWYIKTIRFQIGKNNWHLETCSKKFENTFYIYISFIWSNSVTTKCQNHMGAKLTWQDQWHFSWLFCCLQIGGKFVFLQA